MLDDALLAHVQQALLPLFGGEWVVLGYFGYWSRLIFFLLLIGGACSLLGLGLKLVAVELSLVKNSALRVVEGLRQSCKLGLSHSASFGVLSQGLLALLNGGSSLCLNLELGLVKSLVFFLVLLVRFNTGDLLGDVRFQVVALGLLPSVAVALYSSEREQLLILGEFTVLAHSVEAAHQLNLAGLVGLRLDLLPLLVVGLVSLAVGFTLFLEFDLGFLVLLAVLFLQTSCLSHLDHIVDSSVECLLVKTGLVLKADSHVGAETGHLEEVNLLFSDDLGDHEELGDNFAFVELDRGHWVSFVVKLDLGLNLFAFSRHLFLFKNVEGKTAARLQNLVDNELVLLVSVAKVNMVGRLFINVRLVVVAILDGLLGLHDLSNVDGGGTGAGLQVVVEQLQLVAQISGNVDLVIEAVDLLLPLLGDFLLLLFGGLARCLLFVVLDLVGLDHLGLLLL